MKTLKTIKLIHREAYVISYPFINEDGQHRMHTERREGNDTLSNQLGDWLLENHKNIDIVDISIVDSENVCIITYQI